MTVSNGGSSGAGKRVFSGIQPTGEAHLGNYLGALRRWVEMQEGFDAFYCVVDLHAMTLPWDATELPKLTIGKAAELIACGLDPSRSVLFVQSHVHEHAELAWVLSCVARMGELRRMIQFKEKSKGENESVGVGLFTYPVLQAADVLAYKADGVPVGEDQRQHVELMRDIAIRFNGLFGDVLVVPEAWIADRGARVMALDDPTQKMSKSAARPNSSILLVDPPELIARKLKSAVTDSGRDVVSGPDKPALTNLLTIYSLVTGESVQEIEQRLAGAGYKELKEGLAEAVIEHLRPIRERYLELTADPGEMTKTLARGAERAAVVAAATMAEVKDRTGLLTPLR